MPLRFLSYVDELYKRYTSTSHKKIYGDDLIKIPAPEFYVFYDGTDTSFEQQTLKLSNAFETLTMLSMQPLNIVWRIMLWLTILKTTKRRL